MAARSRPASAGIVRLGNAHRDAIQASMLLQRLHRFVKSDPENQKPDERMSKTQVHAALALLKKILPDLASVEVSGNPEKPLMVQVVRFSDGEELLEPRPVLDMGKLIEMDKAETLAIEAESTADQASEKPAPKRRGPGKKPPRSRTSLWAKKKRQNVA